MDDFLHHLPEFIGNHTLLAILFVVLLGVLIAGEVSRLFRAYRELTPAALTLLINRENALVIDLSSQQDFDKGHIAGARHVVMSQFDPENKELAKVRDLPVAVYCKTGNISPKAAARLVKAGFRQVYWLGGGLAAWRQADLPTTRGK